MRRFPLFAPQKQEAVDRVIGAQFLNQRLTISWIATSIFAVVSISRLMLPSFPAWMRGRITPSVTVLSRVKRHASIVQ